MTARPVGHLLPSLPGLKVRRSNQPVRRDSRYAGERESQVWRRLGDTKQEARKLIAARLQAAERYERHHKAENKRNGPLGHVGIEVLRELYRIVDFKTGRLEPAIATICGRIRRSRAAVVAAMARLKEHGFLEWIRRSEPTHNEGAGPQVRQITNAYGFGLPRAAAAWVKRIMGKGPPPDCEVARREEDAAAVDAMIDTTTLAEQARFHAGDTALGDQLARMGAALSRSASSPDGQKPGIGD